MSGKSDNPNFVAILGRAFQIMDCILESPEPIGVSQISKLTEIPKANTFRILKTLEELDAITEIGDGYVLSTQLIKYGNGAKRHNKFLPVVAPYVERLAHEVGESVNLGIQYYDSVLVIHSETGDASTAVVSYLSPIMAMYCSSIGKLLLSYKSDEEIDEYFSKTEIVARTVRTLKSKEDFLKEREEILKEGIAYDREEYDYGLSCFSMPIRNMHGDIVAGLSISGPTSRLNYKGVEHLQEVLRKTVDEINFVIKDREIDLPEVE